MKRELSCLFFVLLVFSFLTIGSVSSEYSGNFTKISFEPQIVSSTFISNGTLYVGDTNYTLYRSDDNGSSFKLLCTFPNQSNPTGEFIGYVMTLFSDSRDYIFVSIPSTNRLYRSTDLGVTFSEVLNTNGTRNEAFFIAITEDTRGNLYTAIYDNTVSASVLKSTDGGASWFNVLSLHGVAHLHNVMFNPSNDYLYAISGEWAFEYDNSQSERVFRSKDFGKTWTIVVERPIGEEKYGETIYLTHVFDGNWVYLGTDQAFKPNWIDRFYDNGSQAAFKPERVFTSPESDGTLPFISACWFNDTIIFSSTTEFSAGTSRIISSKDGTTWTTLKTTNYSISQHHCNKLTTNPKGIIFGSDGPNANFAILQFDPIPLPTPTVQPTPNPTTRPSAIPTPKPKPTTSPPAPTPAPISPTITPSQTPEEKFENSSGFNTYYQIATIILIGSAVSAVALVARKYKK